MTTPRGVRAWGLVALLLAVALAAQAVAAEGEPLQSVEIDASSNEVSHQGAAGAVGADVPDSRGRDVEAGGGGGGGAADRASAAPLPSCVLGAEERLALLKHLNTVAAGERIPVHVLQQLVGVVSCYNSALATASSAAAESAQLHALLEARNSHALSLSEDLEAAQRQRDTLAVARDELQNLVNRKAGDAPGDAEDGWVSAAEHNLVKEQERKARGDVKACQQQLLAADKSKVEAEVAAKSHQQLVQRLKQDLANCGIRPLLPGSSAAASTIPLRYYLMMGIACLVVLVVVCCIRKR